MRDIFLFGKEKWIGEGTLEISSEKAVIPFYLNLQMQPEDGPRFSWCQEIHSTQLGDVLMQCVFLQPTGQKSFSSRLENETFGIHEGAGFYDERFLGFEMNNPQAEFQGYEHFSLTDDGKCLIEGEYLIGRELTFTMKGMVTAYETASI